MKVCARCRKGKRRSAFTANSKCLDGLQSWCRKCMSDYSRERRRRDPAIRLSGEGVVCAVRGCGVRRDLLARHLRADHGLSVAEYRLRYPGAPTISENLRAAKRDIWVDQNGPVKWTCQAMIGAVQAYACRLGRVPTTGDWDARPRRRGTVRSFPPTSKIITAFGTWDGAMAACGFVRCSCGRGWLLTHENVLRSTA